MLLRHKRYKISKQKRERENVEKLKSLKKKEKVITYTS